MFSLAAYEYHRNKVFMKLTHQNLRDVLDPFDMPDERFREMYRLPRCLALDFLHRLSEHIGDDNVCPEVPLTIQFCSTLNFYASGSYQRQWRINLWYFRDRAPGAGNLLALEYGAKKLLNIVKVE